jgi:hypothetical protein
MNDVSFPASTSQEASPTAMEAAAAEEVKKLEQVTDSPIDGSRPWIWHRTSI